MREIWLMQPRFDRRGGSGPFSLVEQPRYRAGFDFLRLRADAGDADPALADWWEDFALGSEEDRRALLDDVKATERAQPREPREPGMPASDAVKKRRRRRRPSKGRGDATTDGAGEGAAPPAPAAE